MNDGDQPTPRRRIRFLLLLLALGPILIVIGHALTVPMTLTAHHYVAEVSANRREYATGGLLSAAGVFMLVPSLIGMLAMLGSRLRILTCVAVTLAEIGAMALGVGVAMVTLVMGTLAGSDVALAEKAYNVFENGGLVILPFALAPLFFVGVLLLGIALMFQRSLRQSGALLFAGVIVSFFAPGGGLSGAALHVPLALGFMHLSYTLWRVRADEPRTAPPVAMPMAGTGQLA